MSRVETIGNGVTLYLGDCREIMPTLGKVDAVVTDPPYGIGFKPGTRSTKSNDIYAGGSFRTKFTSILGDETAFDPTPFLGWPCILWGANNYAAALPASNGWLCWYKAGGIVGFRMSECELAWSNAITSTKHLDHLWHGFKRASEVGDKVLHPTQKPVEVMKWCLGFVPDAEVVLDPYMGAGATGVACVKMGRQFIGIEIEPKYFDIACRRIEAATRQPDMLVQLEQRAAEIQQTLDLAETPPSVMAAE